MFVFAIATAGRRRGVGLPRAAEKQNSGSAEYKDRTVVVFVQSAAVQSAGAWAGDGLGKGGADNAQHATLSDCVGHHQKREGAKGYPVILYSASTRVHAWWGRKGPGACRYCLALCVETEGSRGRSVARCTL